MIASGQFLDMLDKLERYIRDSDGDYRKFDPEFKQGYQAALADMFRELEREL